MYLIDVACLNQGCREHDVVKRVHLRGVALGVVERPRLVCVHCGGEVSQVGGLALGEGPTVEPRARTRRAAKAVRT